MSEAYAREILRRNVAQICQTIGWNGINSTPLDILVHVLEKYIIRLGTQANRYAEQFNRTEPNLHDLGLVFRDLHFHLPDLAEYTQSVPPVPPPVQIDKFPKPKECNLNFLKPGSHEVVTRPMHVHEHLPPMYPDKERSAPAVASTIEITQNGIDSTDTNASCTSPEISVTDSPEKLKDPFKRPIDPVSMPNSKRPRLRLEEEERTREITSVMMTMSGFLSPAREGKLPEAKPPTIIHSHDKHKPNSHHANPMKTPTLDKSDKKSKKNKLLNGKIMKSKRKDKSHKGESSKSKDGSKANKHIPGFPVKNKDHQTPHHNHVAMSVPKAVPPTLKPPLPPPPSLAVAVPEPIKIKQEPIDTPPVASKNSTHRENVIPVPRRIPISKSPLVSNTSVYKHSHKNQQLINTIISETEIKKESIDEEEKLASQPDRSKINIFKRISNKSKEDRQTPELVSEKLQSESMISRLQNSVNDTPNHSFDGVKIKTEDPVVNNNDDSALDLSKEIDLRTNEVISIDDDSLDMHPALSKSLQPEPRPSISVRKSLQVPFPKDVGSAGLKIKKEKKHKDKKDKLAKLEAKLLKKQQQQLAQELAKTEKQNLKMSTPKPPKRPKNDRLSQLPPGFPFFPGMSPGGGLMPGPSLMHNPGLIPSREFFAGLANNPALRGLPNPNLLTNPFALGAAGPGLIPGPSFLPGGLGPGLPNPLMSMSNFPHSSRSSSSKIPSMLRRPSLEVIPVDSEERGLHKSPIGKEKERHEKHKSQTIPNILQKHKAKSQKDHKSSIYKMPPIQPDITIELNPPKETVEFEPPKVPTPPVKVPTPEPPKPEVSLSKTSEPLEPESLNRNPYSSPTPEASTLKETDSAEKKKEKSHKKEKKDKDGIKIKKKKDKKDKNKDKSEKKREKEEKHELKDKIKKEKKEKKKERLADGLVPKLTLKLNSSNSNSPMPPSSPDTFKLNIKPVVKKEDEANSPREEPTSREHSRSPELAQISALVTRPPKPKQSKHSNSNEEPPPSPPPSSSSPRRNRPPSSHSKYKRILFKPLTKKGHEHFDDDVTAETVEPMAVPPPTEPCIGAGSLPTPFYLDEHGNKIWVCPACGRPDNGSPMIGCDGCDGWYHWVCVGITEEPGATEDWFCNSCLAKRAAMVLAGVTSGKKRGRKPKAEKLRDCH